MKMHSDERYMGHKGVLKALNHLTNASNQPSPYIAALLPPLLILPMIVNICYRVHDNTIDQGFRAFTNTVSKWSTKASGDCPYTCTNGYHELKHSWVTREIGPHRRLPVSCSTSFFMAFIFATRACFRAILTYKTFFTFEYANKASSTTDRVAKTYAGSPWTGSNAYPALKRLWVMNKIRHHRRFFKCESVVPRFLR